MFCLLFAYFIYEINGRNILEYSNIFQILEGGPQHVCNQVLNFDSLAKQKQSNDVPEVRPVVVAVFSSFAGAFEHPRATPTRAPRALWHRTSLRMHQRGSSTPSTCHILRACKVDPHRA